MVKSRSVKRNAKNARGLGRDSLPFFSPPPPPFPSRARLIFALLALIRPHYTVLSESLAQASEALTSSCKFQHSFNHKSRICEDLPVEVHQSEDLETFKKHLSKIKLSLGDNCKCLYACYKLQMCQKF